MNVPIPVLQATALCLSLLWLAMALVARPRRPLNIVWALFCGSMAMYMARGLMGPDAGPWSALLAASACFTCNGFWLVARALFREGRPFATPHVVYVGVVAMLIVASQLGFTTPFKQVVAEVLSLLSSVTLVLAFWEGLRGWPGQRGMERAMRAVFLATYGGCVGIALLLPILLGQSEGTTALCAAVAATGIVFVTQGLVAWRMCHPLGVRAAVDVDVDVDTACAAEARSPDIATHTSGENRDAGIRDEDVELARALEQYMQAQRPFLQPELKLSHLAQALDVSEYRISRAIHDVLGHRNINQYVNAFRLQHAQALLANPACDDWSTLVIGLESGFGSLGAFHRAFKAATGCPPGEFRASRQAVAMTREACTGLGQAS